MSQEGFYTRCIKDLGNDELQIFGRTWRRNKRGTTSRTKYGSGKRTSSTKSAGSLIWLSTRTRPDITYAQSRISSMATKAPKRAFLEGMRVLRYFSGTRDLCVQFRSCTNFKEVIAYTDANFSVKRSQTGAVIKLGINVVAWRSMKQTDSAISTAESEVQALASTEVLAEYIRTLR